MKYKNLMDMHTHTDNSPDAEHSAVLMCEKGFNAGLRAIAITDHCECDAYLQHRYDISLRQSVFESYKARAAFAGRMVVVLGVELGQPLHDLKTAEKIVSQKFDFILVSQHSLTTKEDFYKLDYSLEQNNPHELLNRYFDELLEIAKWGKFDSLAHLTYPIRYIKGTHGIDIDLARYYDKIDEILKTLALNGKALEINTSGLRQQFGELMPTIDILKRFKALGGEFITVGSDAHTADEVAANITDGLAAAQESGFKYITLYKERTPIQISFT
ncbi:MAG TPA: histidinol-phosphatase HisJ family protein [Clostridiales bacterium]|nr:histidinol-phosphatase HisJ family protein [Clostridiales bacterium]